MISVFETAHTEASASPLKPSVRMLLRSSLVVILLVACLKNAFGTSSNAIPHPSSVIRIKVEPPRFISTVMCRDPASMEFSISSFITDDGHSITSPAAISSDISLLKRFIVGIRRLLSEDYCSIAYMSSSNSLHSLSESSEIFVFFSLSRAFSFVM